MPGSYRSSQKLRMELAHVAARLIAVDGINDYLAAKKKAALQLGRPPGRNLPTNSEIEQALIDYQNLFQGEEQSQLLEQRRRIAASAMHLLRDYQPALVGSVLRGTATGQSSVEVHVFTDEPEQIGLLLDEHGIPCRLADKGLRHGQQEPVSYPVYQFRAGDIPVNLIVLPLNRRHMPPMSPVDGRPMQRAGLEQLQHLLGDSDD